MRRAQLEEEARLPGTGVRVRATQWPDRTVGSVGDTRSVVYAGLLVGLLWGCGRTGPFEDSLSGDDGEGGGTDDHDASGDTDTDDAADDPDETDGDDDDDDDDDDDSGGDDDDDDDAGGVFSAITGVAHPRVHTIPIVTWSQNIPTQETRIEFTFEDDEWYESPREPRGSGDHSEVLLGVPEGVDVSYRIVGVADGKDIGSDLLAATNGLAPDAMPRASVVSHEPDLAGPHQWLLGAVSEQGPGGYGGPHWMYIIDRQARVVWYYRPAAGVNGELNQGFWPRLSRDGTHISIDRQIRGEEGILLFTTLDFEYEREVELPGQEDCYDVTVDGYVLFNTGHTLKEVSPEGALREIWRCEFERCYSNTVSWDPLGDTVLMSFPYVNTVVRIDRESGELLSTWGDEGDWQFEPNTLGLDFNHWAHITAEGTFMVSSHRPGTDTHLFMEYEIDEGTKTLVSKWTYGDGQPDWPEERGMAALVPGSDGNVIGNYGPAGVIVEVTADGELAWRVEHGARLLGNNVFVDDLYLLNRGPAR